MLINDLLNLETRQKLIQFSIWSNATKVDRQRKIVKGNSFAEEVIQIRLMTKRQLSKYLREIDNNKAVKVARKIKDRTIYNQFDKGIRNKIELYSYAFNRKLSL
jgi:hypothetical protein|tara:strand:- start:3875 stop:4186 length:312 start_codon:yes stop_codon:yes gene_type:complete